jgi:hypothetical protein
MFYTPRTLSRRAIFIFAGLLGTFLVTDQRASSQGPPSRAESELRAVCDALIDRAVKRPYGWGWQSGTGLAAKPVGGAADKAKFQEVSISMMPEESPAAALLLLETGVLLDEEKYLQAARTACRGFSAAADTGGRLPAEVTFGAQQVVRRERLGLIVDQSPAAAAAGVMLTFERLRPEERDRLFALTAKLVTALNKQVTASGGIATDFVGERRVVRLDRLQVRDVGLILGLSASVHRDVAHKQSAIRLGDYLMRARSTDAGMNLGRGLWLTAYEMDGQPVQDDESVPPLPNMPASAGATSLLLANHLRNGDAQTFGALVQVADAAASLRQPDGKWKRLVAAEVAKSADATTSGGGVFGPVKDGSPTDTTDTWGWPGLLKSLNDLRLLGREDYLNLTKSVLPQERWAAWTLCHQLTEPAPTDLPLSAREVPGFIDRHPTWFPGSDPRMTGAAAGVESLSTVTTADLSHRGFGLLLKVQLDRAFAPAAGKNTATSGGR